MQFSRLEPAGLALLRLAVHRDARGYFIERFRDGWLTDQRLAALGLPTRFSQDNHSRSGPGVLRGLHYQYRPAQGKLVGVIRGRIWDVAVDVRPESPTYGKHLGLELNGDDGTLLWIPPGFAHGFCVLGDEPADVIYKVDAPYDVAGEGGIFWADPDLAIAWPVVNPIVSARDEQLSSFAAYKARPRFGADLQGQ